MLELLPALTGSAALADGHAAAEGLPVPPPEGLALSATAHAGPGARVAQAGPRPDLPLSTSELLPTLTGPAAVASRHAAAEHLPLPLSKGRTLTATADAAPHTDVTPAPTGPELALPAPELLPTLTGPAAQAAPGALTGGHAAAEGLTLRPAQSVDPLPLPAGRLLVTEPGCPRSCGLWPLHLASRLPRRLLLGAGGCGCGDQRGHGDGCGSGDGPLHISRSSCGLSGVGAGAGPGPGTSGGSAPPPGP